MSVQFGRCALDGSPIDMSRFEQVRRLLSAYGPDGEGSFIQPSAAIVYRGFHTTAEAEREQQPCLLSDQSVITWDGRLDNREELIDGLSDAVSPNSTDASILAAAYERWSTACFAKLTGDWAVSIWNQRERLLILAKDFIGVRPLYYCVDKDQVTWSTLLEPLVLCSGRSFAIQEEYIAGWLSYFPAANLTPYAEISSVPPSHFVSIRAGAAASCRYWDFSSAKSLRYRRDEDYEEHFRNVFEESIRRRLRANRPVLAELSGGIDSSSIVCIADELIARNHSITPRLDTVSYYDDSQPTWNERPYFSKIEEKRGVSGSHIDAGLPALRECSGARARVAVTPAHVELSNAISEQLAECMTANGNRVLLSGIGGDEVTGGVPTAVPEICDLLLAGEWTRLARQLTAWALHARRPWFHLLGESAGKFLPSIVGDLRKGPPPCSWLTSEFAKRHSRALAGYPSRLRVVGARPSFQENLFCVEALRRQLACDVTRSGPPREKRYPYLDRDLLEFLFAIPREQLIRPGQRRSLLRRALAAAVPADILYRKTKAYVARLPAPELAMCNRAMQGRDCLSESLGIVESSILRDSMRSAQALPSLPIVPLVRTISLELWLKSVRNYLQLAPVSERSKPKLRLHVSPCSRSNSAGLPARNP